MHTSLRVLVGGLEGFGTSIINMPVAPIWDASIEQEGNIAFGQRTCEKGLSQQSWKGS